MLSACLPTEHQKHVGLLSGDSGDNWSVCSWVLR